MLYSVVDVGSNTVRLVTYETDGKNYKTVYTDFRALGLISEIENNKLADGAIEKLCQTLLLFKTNSPDGAEFTAFATAFMRVIDNAQDVVEKIKSITGIELEILSEEQEALYSFAGITRSLEETSGIAADFGGGSCEFIKFSDSLPTEYASLPFGCVKLAKMFVHSDVFPTLDEMKKIRNYVQKQLSTLPWIKKSPTLVLTGGTARAFAQMNNFHCNTNLRLSNYLFTKESFAELYNVFTTFDAQYTNFIVTVMPGRIKTVYPGFAAVKAIIDYISCDTVTISTEGVREGYLAEKLRR